MHILEVLYMLVGVGVGIGSVLNGYEIYSVETICSIIVYAAGGNAVLFIVEQLETNGKIK